MLSLCLIKHYEMNTYWRAEVEFQTFLISALDGGGGDIINVPAALSPGKESPVTFNNIK
jgi:hypothetical protein